MALESRPVHVVSPSYAATAIPSVRESGGLITTNSSGSRPDKHLDAVAEIASLNDALELHALLSVDGRHLQAGASEQHRVCRQSQALRRWPAA
jgi:hypothetical protein